MFRNLKRISRPMCVLAVGVLFISWPGHSASANDNPALGIGEPTTPPNPPPPPPPCPGSPECDCNGGGCPVYVSSGKLFKNFSDLYYNVGNRMQFRIARTFHSDDFYVGYFGRCVSSSLEMLGIPTFKGQLTNHVVVVHWPDGRRSTFTKQPDQSYSASFAAYESLTKVPGGFELREKNGVLYTFDEDTKILSMEDPDGNAVTFAYDANRRPITVTLFNNRQIDIMYNAAGFVDTVSDFAGRTVSYQYDASGNITTYTDPESKVWTYQYANDLLTGIVNPLGQTMFSATYDAQRRVVNCIDIEGNYTFTYNTNSTFKQDNQFGAGIGWRFDYNAQGQITRVVRPDGVTVNHGFNAMGQQTTQGSGTGSWTLTYDSKGNVIRTVDPLGAITNFTYDPVFNFVETETNHFNIVTKNEYGPTGLRTREVRAFGHASQIERTFAYDSAGNMTMEADFKGLANLYEYDANNYMTKKIDRESNEWTYQYDSRGNLLLERDPLGNETTYTYDKNDHLLTETDALGRTVAHAYDDAGRRVATTDRRGSLTNYEYDQYGSLTAVVGPEPSGGAGRPRTEYLRDSHSWITRITDANGKRTDLEYSRLGVMTRKTERAAAGDLVTSWTLNNEGFETAMTDTAAGSVTYTYDANNKPLVTTRTLGGGRVETETFAYDLLGRRTQETLATGQIRTFAFDVLDRRTGSSDQIGSRYMVELDPNGHETRLVINGQETLATWDNEERLKTLTDDDGRVTTYFYDARGMLTKIETPGGRAYVSDYDEVGNLVGAHVEFSGSNFESFTYEYDANRNLTAIVNPFSIRTEMQYDALDRMTQRVSAAGSGSERTESFGYSLGGNITMRTLADGGAINYGYDDQNRLTLIDYPGTANDNVYAYGADGRLASASNADSTTNFAYSFFGQVVQQTTDGKVITVDTNVAARTTNITYPSGRSVVRRFDFRDRLTSIEVNSVTVASYTYDNLDHVLTRTYSNTTQSFYGWDARGLPLSVEHRNGGGAFWHKTQGHDDDSLTSYERDELAATESETYAYDGANYLTDRQKGTLDGSNQIPAPTETTEWTHDAAGSITDRSDNGTPSPRTYDVHDQVATVDGAAYVHDARGNLTDDGTYTYEYDLENRVTRMVRTSDGMDVLQVKYDALGNRVQSVYEGGATTRHYWVLDSMIEERDGSDLLQRDFVYRDAHRPAVMYNNGGSPFFYHEDARFNIVALTDNAGSVADQYDYTPYGRTTDTSAVGNPLRWAGQRLDPNGWSHFRYRSYSPDLGRFVQVDPHSTPMTPGQLPGLTLDRQGSYSDGIPGLQHPGPVALNDVLSQRNELNVRDMDRMGMRYYGLQTPDRAGRYAYGGNNPVDRYDADGEIWNPISGGISGCALSGCVLSGCWGSRCLGSACGGSLCGGSVCIKSGCLGSVCRTSVCGGSVCTASACAGSFCGGSVCISSGCTGSVCVASGCALSICSGSVCVGSKCVFSACAYSLCYGSRCGGSACSGSKCLGSICKGTNCFGSACSKGSCNCQIDRNLPGTPEEALASLDIEALPDGGMRISIASHWAQRLTFADHPGQELRPDQLVTFTVSGESAFDLTMTLGVGEDKTSRIEFAQMTPEVRTKGGVACSGQPLSPEPLGSSGESPCETREGLASVHESQFQKQG